jgi:hypothetical protein
MSTISWLDILPPPPPELLQHLLVCKVDLLERVGRIRADASSKLSSPDCGARGGQKRRAPRFQ